MTLNESHKSLKYWYGTSVRKLSKTSKGGVDAIGGSIKTKAEAEKLHASTAKASKHSPQGIQHRLLTKRLKSGHFKESSNMPSETINEAHFDHRVASTHKVMHPEMARQMVRGHDVDFYSPRAGGAKRYGRVTMNDGRHVKIKDHGTKETHIFKIQNHYPDGQGGHIREETLDESTETYKPGDTVHWHGGRYGFDIHHGHVIEIHKGYSEPFYKIKTITGRTAHKFHSELLHHTKEETNVGETSMLNEELDDKTMFTDARAFRKHALKNGLVLKKDYNDDSGSSTKAYHPHTGVTHGIFHHYWKEGTFRKSGWGLSKSGWGAVKEETSMIITHVQNKNAVEFKKALHEKIQERVDAVLAETKVEVASQLMDETKKLGHVAHVTKKPPIKGKPVLPPEKLGEETLDEKVITPGTVEHMAHAVHACHSGECEAHSTRGTFTTYHHPHYHISRDNGSINPDKHEMNYFVQGAGGMHKFSAEHTKAGIDVKHHGMVG